VVVVNMSAMPNTESMNNTKIEMTNAEPASFPALFLKAFIEFSPSIFGRQTADFLIRCLINLSYLTGRGPLDTWAFCKVGATR
jgi:hypothetical protein